MRIPIFQLGEIEYSEAQRRRFIGGTLWRDWHRRYPEIFDADDLRLAESQAHLGSHFHEWLGAISLFERFGYLSLVEKYEFSGHRRKHALARHILPPGVLSLLRRQAGAKRSQCPDLLAYSPDLAKWFFCEVKGRTDRLRRPQLEFFGKLATATGRPVALLSLILSGDEVGV
jgi:hypothetical protein